MTNDLDKASVNWWNSVKNDNEKFTSWLKKQYHGEITAAQRMDKLLEERRSEMTKHEAKVLTLIANDEHKHSEWIGNLLWKYSDEYPEYLNSHTARYWDVVLAEEDDMEIGHLWAAAFYAEDMRLARIRAIISDETETRSDVIIYFKKIYRDEMMHRNAFKKMAEQRCIWDDVDWMSIAKEDHLGGIIALGLVE